MKKMFYKKSERGGAVPPMFPMLKMNVNLVSKVSVMYLLNFSMDSVVFPIFPKPLGY